MARRKTSIFSDVVSKLVWIVNPFPSTLFKYTPFLITLLTAICLFKWLDFSTLNSEMMVLSSQTGNFQQYNIITLSGNAVLIVIVTAIAYFYRENILKFDNIEKITQNIENHIRDQKIGGDKEDNIEGIRVTFIDNCKEDLKLLEKANKVLNKFGNRTYILATVLIFISTGWGVLDLPLCYLLKNSSSPDFSVTEFETHDIPKLCATLRKDGLTIQNDTVDELNKLLKQPDLYSKIKQKKKLVPSKKIEDIEKHYNSQNNENTLKALNRTTLEEFYPHIIPTRQNFWLTHRLSVGFSINILTFLNIFIYGIILLLIISFIKYLIDKSLRLINIEKQYSNYIKSFHRTSQAASNQKIEEIKTLFGID